jgi:alpha-glucosidase
MVWDARQMRASVDALEAALPPFAWPNYVLGNHDRMRLVTRFGGHAQARVAAMMLLTLRGTPTLYYGDEIGMADVPIPPDRVQDPQGLNLGVERTRDGCRTPMQWDGSPNSGFCPPSVEPWLPLATDHRERNVATQAEDPTSLLTLYRRLLALRRATPALVGGGYRPVDEAPNDCFAYWRNHNEQRLLVALNFSDAPREIASPGLAAARVILSTYLDREGPLSGAVLALRPNEGVIVAV